MGYVDPDVLAAREAALRSQLEAELQEATKRYETGDIDQAAHLLERLAIDDPDWVAPHHLLAEIYYRAGRLDDSQSQLDWLTEHGVERPRLALMGGAMALAKRDFAAALEALKYAAHVEPKLPSVHTLLGKVLLRLGKLDSAKDSFQIAVQHNPSDAFAYDGLAAIQLRCGEFEDAANFALESLEHDMQLFAAHYRLGLALANLGRPREAITALQTSARTNINRAAPYYWMSRIAEKQLADPVLASHFFEQGREVVRRRRQCTAQNLGDAHGDR